MPFDPKLIHEPDPPLAADGEVDLPDDLAALASQLRDDSVGLAARYPASQRLSKPYNDRREHSVALIAGIGSAVALVIIAIALFAVPLVSDQGPHAATPIAPPMPPGVQTRDMHVPEYTYISLSGPEAEAALDLARPHSAENTTISF